MYIAENNCRTQGLRKAHINAITADRYKLNKSVKELKKLDASKRLARRFTDIKYYGGSLKSFWNKVKKFGKKVWNSAKKVAKVVYKPVKWGLKTLQKEPIATLVSKGADAVGAAVGVPAMGKIVSTAIKGADSVTDVIENLVHGITEKNPNVTVQEAKKLVTTVKDVVDDVGKQMGQENASQEIVNKIKDQGQKVLNKLPTLIKNEGYDKVEKAAGYLPFIDPKTYTKKERTGKGGKILKPAHRFVKPKIVTKYQKIFEKYGVPKYNPDAVGEVGGRLFLGGRFDLGGAKKEEVRECGMPNPLYKVGKAEKKKKLSEEVKDGVKGGASKESLLDILRSRVDK